MVTSSHVARPNRSTSLLAPSLRTAAAWSCVRSTDPVSACLASVWPGEISAGGFEEPTLLFGGTLLWRYVRVARRDPDLVACGFFDLQGPLSSVGLLDTGDRAELLLRLGVSAVKGACHGRLRIVRYFDSYIDVSPVELGQAVG